ncbi:MAG: hypothetical protein ACFB0B_09770 [Thermonemataceae bacterium]
MFLYWGVLMGLALMLLNIVVTTLFIEYYNIQTIYLIFIMTAVMAVIGGTLYNYAQLYFSYKKVAFLSALILVIGIATIFVEYSFDEFQFWLYPLALAINIFSYIIFQGVFERVFNVKDTRGGATRVSLGFTLAGIIAVLLILNTANAAWFNLSLTLLVALVLGFLALIPLSLIINRISFTHANLLNAQEIRASNNWLKLANNRYFRLITYLTTTSIIVSVITDFFFLRAAFQRYSSDLTGLSDIISFLCIAIGFTVAFSFIIKNFLLRFLIQRFGIQITLYVPPIILGTFLIILLVITIMYGSQVSAQNTYLFFVVSVICKIVKDTMTDAIDQNVIKYYLFPIPSELRFDTQTKLDTTLKGVALALGAGIVYLYYWLPPLTETLIAIAFCGAIIVMVNNLHKRYRQIIKETLDSNQQQQEAKISSKKTDSRNLAAYLAEQVVRVPDKQVAIYLNILSIINPVLFRSAVQHLITAKSNRTQKIALQQASEWCILEVTPPIEEQMQLKYFAVLDNAELMTKTYSRLKDAERRLEKIKYVEQLTYSKLDSERLYGAFLSAYTEEFTKVKLLNKLFRDPNYQVRYHSLVSSAGCEGFDLHNNMIEKLDTALYSNAAFAAIVATGEPIFPSLESAFYLTGQKENIQLRIIQAYEHIASQEAIRLLIKKVNHPNLNVSARALEAVGRCGYQVNGDRKILINQEIEDVCETITWNMAIHLDLEGFKVSELLLRAVVSEVDENMNYLYRLLSLIFDPTSIDLVKRNINSKNDEQASFALELLDVVIPDTMKPMLLPILTPYSYEEKVEIMQDVFPTDKMEKEAILLSLIQRDFKQVNVWTKACALEELSKNIKEAHIEILMANIIHPANIISELAYKIMLINFSEHLGEHLPRFNQPRFRHLRDLTEKLRRTQFRDTYTRFEIAKFMSQIPIFEKISGLQVATIAQLVEVIEATEGEVIGEYEYRRELDYWIIYEGEVALKASKQNTITYQQGAFIHSFEATHLGKEHLQLQSHTELIAFKIKREVFNELLCVNEKITLYLINNIDLLINQNVPA